VLAIKGGEKNDKKEELNAKYRFKMKIMKEK